MTGTDDHKPAQFYWDAETEHCPHKPIPERNTDAWDEWMALGHQPYDDGVLCLDAPARNACAECSANDGEFVPWTACRVRSRRKDQPMPNQPTTHQPETVLGGALECVERECEDFFTEDGDEIPGKETCSHMTELEICTGCTAANGAPGDFPPVVAWADCPHRDAATPAT